MNKEELDDQEQSDLFFAIFKVLNCHFLEDQGI